MNNKHFPKFLHSNQLRKNKKSPQSNTCLNVGLCLETKSMMHNSLSSLTFIYIYIYMFVHIYIYIYIYIYARTPALGGGVVVTTSHCATDKRA